ncbi:tetraacyldisaccharide 4'-kinase [Mesorhizobium sp. VNQ89]|uniref:tetraacyldisaccharide 4'-kinase n=1 Tax=Mesorhizobium quangtriensis TaxID=3157709 RepID=UPI0032B7D290
MAAEAPPFWWEKTDWRARALYPVSRVYGSIARRRMVNARRERLDVPVLCVGNFTVGGTGKTPVAIALAKQAKQMNLTPGFLSRGYGGTIHEPHVVDRKQDSARQVGDEPLLLSDHALTATTPNRVAGANLLLDRGCNFIIMDDGFQSAHIHMDYALVVVDGRYGIGNGHVLPGGPLRAPLIDQVRLATGIVRMGDDQAGETVVRQAARAGKPIFEAWLKARSAEKFAGRRFLAFAGIGHPEKFFATVANAGGEIVTSRSFPDHHFYSNGELTDLVTTAREGGLEVITTAKDFARLRNGIAPSELIDKLNVLEIDAVFENANATRRIISETQNSWRDRRLSR